MTILDALCEKMEHLRKWPQPNPVIRIHPDDYHELRRECLHYKSDEALNRLSHFGGIKVIVDPKAPYLPRK